jgi:hypothetical protein
MGIKREFSANFVLSEFFPPVRAKKSPPDKGRRNIEPVFEYMQHGVGPKNATATKN